MKRLIKHQMQPCPVSCVSTCLAMLSGLPAQEVIDLYHSGYRDHSIKLRAMLDGLGIEFHSFDSVDGGELCYEGAYLCTTPSLNIRGGVHQVIIELTDTDYFVLDPVMGREDRLYYVKRGAASSDLEVELGGFVVDAFIPAAWLAARS